MDRQWILPILSIAVVLASGTLMAQQASGGSVPTVGLPDWATGSGIVVGLCGGPVFAIWLSYHYTVKVIPRKEKMYSEETKAARDDYQKTLVLMQSQFLETLEKTEQRHADHISILTTNSREDVREAWKTAGCRYDENK